MRIDSLRVDGFGQLSDFALSGLSDKLVVLSGPNEAGKSTLLDFIRTMLFGFPDRRTRTSTHPPLRGGRHGGLITVRDDRDAPWTIERHADSRAASVTGPDGTFGDEDTIRRLLGGADEALFRSVFAFGLSELSAFESLDRDEVRDLVFSAGILGAGRSAMRAANALDQQRAAIVRPRQADAEANRLRRTLDDVDQRLRAARGDASAFGTARAARDRLAEQLSDARADTARLRQRDSELERAVSCLARYQRARQAAATLGALGEPGPRVDALLARRVEINRLSAERSGHAERVNKRAALISDLDAIDRSRRDLEVSLGPLVDLGRIRAVRPGVVERTNAETLAKREHSEAALVENHERQLEDATTRAEHADAARRGAVSHGVASNEDLSERAGALGELQGLILERDRLAADAAQHALVAMTLRTQPRVSSSSRLVTALLATSAVVLGAVAAIAAGAHHVSIAAGVATGAIFIAGAAGLLRAEQRRAVDPDVSTAGRSGGPDLGRLDDKIRCLTQRIGLDDAPTGFEVELLRRRLDEERESRINLDQLARDWLLAHQSLDVAESRLEHRRRALDDVMKDINAEAMRLGLPMGLGATGLLRALDVIERLVERDMAHERVRRALDDLNIVTSEFEKAIASLAPVLGPGEHPTPEVALDQVVEALAAAESDARARAELRSVIATSDAMIDESSADDAQRRWLHAELERGDLSGWQRERREVAQALVTAQDGYDELLRRHAAASRALDDLLATDEVAALELERATLTADLQDAMSRWAKLSAAGHLLSRTLGRYERERQPEVINRAGELFADVSAGRYVKLVAREDPDGRRRGIEAIAASGARVDASSLSHGTAEQLYLCLRLALASTYASGATTLPLVLDDVLVNFDPIRAKAVANAVLTTSRAHQVLAFTCHPHIVELFAGLDDNVQLIELDSSLR